MGKEIIIKKIFQGSFCCDGSKDIRDFIIL